MEKIQEGFDVFAHDGEMAFGAVRAVTASDIRVYVENAGDFTIPRAAVQDVHDGKVVVHAGRLPPQLQDAIRRARIGEDPRVASE
jgi:hypothetical protein